ncbi:hypothetical protein QQP08_006474 [Theobroma cacao]|nr:hypothetical protein QQP08_006474 [Theobroma cacao]
MGFMIKLSYQRVLLVKPQRQPAVHTLRRKGFVLFCHDNLYFTYDGVMRKFLHFVSSAWRGAFVLLIKDS